MRYKYEGRPALYFRIDENGDYNLEWSTEDPPIGLYKTRDDFEKKVEELSREGATVFSLKAFQIGLLQKFITKA